MGLDITFLIAYLCVARSVRHWEPWACLAHCRRAGRSQMIFTWETYTEHARGDNFASMSSVFNKCFFMEMPNSHSFDEFSERLQIVLFTLRDPELNAVYSGNADVSHVPSVSWRQVLGRSSWSDGFRKEVPPQRYFGSRFHSRREACRVSLR